MRFFRQNIRLPKTAVLLVLAAVIAGIGCGSRSSYVSSPVAVRVPTPDTRVAAPPDSACPPVPIGPPEVVEKSVASLGGPKTVIHEVGPLETIWRISRMYDVRPQAIYTANGIGSKDVLRIGQKLVIPHARKLRYVINLYHNSQWHYIILHHTATDMGNAKTINLAHGARGFWNGLGYHFLIDNGTLGKGDGQIEMSPRWIRQQEGAHCKADGMNDKSIGIALVGNFNNESPTPNQMQSLMFLLRILCNYYHIPSPCIMGHREVPGAATECPGSRFPLAEIRRSLSQTFSSRK